MITMTQVPFSDSGKTFADLLLAETYVASVLSRDIPNVLAKPIAEHFVLYCDESYTADDWPNDTRYDEAEVIIGGPINFLSGPWTIREKELGDLREIARGVIAASIASDSRVSIAAMVMSVLCMLWRLQRKGVALHPLQKHILMTLRRVGPLTTVNLARKLNDTTPSVQWTEADVENTLAELTCVRLNDGSTEPLVHKANDGLWSTDARGLWEIPRGSSG